MKQRLLTIFVVLTVLTAGILLAAAVGSYFRHVGVYHATPQATLSATQSTPHWTLSLGITQGWLYWEWARAEIVSQTPPTASSFFSAGGQNAGTRWMIGETFSPSPRQNSWLLFDYEYADRPPAGGFFGNINLHFTNFSGRISIWALLLPVLALAGWMIYRRRRAIRRLRESRLKLCEFCGYDLRASPGICPECGKAPAPT